METDSDDDFVYPRYRIGIRVGLVVGLLVFAGWMGWIWFLAGTLPNIGPVSFVVSISPWWRLGNWLVAGTFGVWFGFIGFGVASFRPPNK